MCLVLFVNGYAQNSSDATKDALTSEDVQCWKGEALEIPVYITNNTEVRDIQFDVDLISTSGVELQTVECNLSGYTATFSQLKSKGNYRVIISSLTGATIPVGNKTPLCTLKTEETPNGYYVRWYLTGIAFSHTDGTISYPDNNYSMLDIRFRDAWLLGDMASGDPGETILLPIRLTNNYAVRDFQFEVYLDPDFTLNEVVDVPAGYTTAFNRLQNDHYRVLITSLTDATIPAGDEQPLCKLKVTLPEYPKDVDCLIENSVFSYSDGELSYGNNSSGHIQTNHIASVWNLDCTLSDSEVSLAPSSSCSFRFTYNYSDFNYSYGRLFEGYIADEGGNHVQDFSDYYSRHHGNSRWINLNLKALDDSKTYTMILTRIRLGEYYDENDQQCWEYDKDVNISWTFRTLPANGITLDFQKGWNWFSYNVDNDKLMNCWDFGNAVAPYVTYFANQTEQATYDEEERNWYGYVNMTPSYSYKAYATESHTFKFRGENLPVDWYDLSLYPGWNWIGYLPAAPLLVSEAFADYEPEEGDFIKSQTESATYFDGQWIGDFVMEPGQGYLYKSCKTYSEWYYYPIVEASESRAAHSSAARAAALTADNGFFAYDTHKYRDNMAIVARIEGDIEGRYVIGAYAVAADATVTSDMECRGKSVAAGGLHLITAHGDDDTTTLRFAILDTFTGELYAAHETIDFDGTSAGTAAHPVVLSLGELIGNVTTGISFPAIGTADGSDVYAIDGRRATRRTHGVVIESGRKTIVK